MMTTTKITDAQIDTIRARALRDGDGEIVDLCDAATSAAVAKHSPGRRERARRELLDLVNKDANVGEDDRG